jgi:hypothetical protein
MYISQFGLETMKRPEEFSLWRIAIHGIIRTVDAKVSLIFQNSCQAVFHLIACVARNGVGMGIGVKFIRSLDV